jgi:predicted RNase H-like nuclease (RuvC/YqgF family)
VRNGTLKGRRIMDDRERLILKLNDELRTLKEDVEFLGAIHETDRKRIEKLEETISMLRTQLEDEADKKWELQQELNRLKPDTGLKI